jgi:5-methylcytosine-specific restriction endonuclease McrA
VVYTKKQREYNKKEYQKNKERRRVYMIVYNQTPEGKASQVKYRRSQKAKERDKRFHIKHRKKRNEYSRQYYQEHKKYFNSYIKKRYEIKNEEIKEKAKKFYQKHKSKIIKQTKEYNKRHKEEKQEYVKEYRKNHKEKIRKQRKGYLQTPNGAEASRKASRKRRAYKNNIIEAYTQKEWTEKLNKTKGICPECKRNVGIDKLQLDHIYPISKASEDFKKIGVKKVYKIDDVQPLCINCNSSKWSSIFN